MWSSLVLIALLASAQGRAVNISNTWVLPEEGFPVFYRYFRDRISWYEADAVCQFHHANLVTVDTTAQYDAVRAYLKELDISSAVWVGLIRSNPDGDFTWTDYRGLSGDGYWSSAPDTRSAPLCAAANPVADYRWEARACGGPSVASFICELPVPQWALGNEGCMVRELPALTILYLPESAAVQLNADCGLAGVKRVECTGNVKREGLLKDLSCADEDDVTSTGASTSTGTNWPATTDFTADPDINSEVITEENETTEHEVDTNQPIDITTTSIPQYVKSKAQYKSQTKFTDMDNFNTVTYRKDINLGGNDDQNIQSNFIPKNVDENNGLINEQLQKLENARNMQHKMIHEEIARVGNLNNIFSQPADHFIPPLVMAKSRMSDDMTVLSLAEKHAQQLAEKHFSKQKHIEHVYVDATNNKLTSENTRNDKPLIKPVKPNNIKDNIKETLKSHVPKKYVNDKYNEFKGKSSKWESKTTEIEPEGTTATTKSISNENRTTTATSITNYHDKIDEDFAMDLKVMLKDASFHSEEQTSHSNYAGNAAKLDLVNTPKTFNKTINDVTSTEKSSTFLNSEPENKNVTMEHQVIKITVISNADPIVNTSVFEITTKMPIFRDDADKSHTFSTSFSTTATVPRKTQTTEEKAASESALEVSKITTQSEFTTVPVTFPVTATTAKPVIENITMVQVETERKTILPELTTDMSISLVNKSEISELPTTMSTTAFSNISDEINKGVTEVTEKIADDLTLTNNHNDSDSLESHTSLEKLDFNNTEIHDIMDKNMTDSEEIIDANSPLLSGLYEPMHRPPRTRRPQQQNRKFNPFRILG